MLSFDIDWSQLKAIGDDLGATDKQVKYAFHRGLRRTEASLRKLSSKGLSQELQLRVASALRKRLKTIKLKMGTGDGSLALWYGLNDLPISSFKGRPVNSSGGARFRDRDYPEGFVAMSKVKGKLTIFKRKGKAKLPIIEQLYPIEDKAIVYIEDQVFEKVEEIFWQHFSRDLHARVKFQLGES